MNTLSYFHTNNILQASSTTINWFMSCLLAQSRLEYYASEGDGVEEMIELRKGNNS